MAFRQDVAVRVKAWETPGITLSPCGGPDVRPMTALLLAFLPAAAPAREPGATDAAIDRGLGSLVEGARAWRKEHNCVSCHHAALVVWALREAKQRGRTVDEPFLAEFTRWVAASGDGRTGLPRPPSAPRALHGKAVWFALALGAGPAPDEAVRKGRGLLLTTVKRDQTENGSWSAWPETRPPIFGNSGDGMTALATLAVLPHATDDDTLKAARDRGMAWLARTATDGDPQAVAVRLVLWARLGRPADEREALVRRIVDRQNADGGWSQAAGMASDAWATGQALYALAEAGRAPADAVVARGQVFLVRTQRGDGTWPMMSRPTTPGGKVEPGKTAITGAGSAWAVLGLIRSAGDVPRRPGK
jgi:hypothetical protein